MKRRQLFGTGVMIFGSFAIAWLRRTEAAAGAAAWGYLGDRGPETWGDLDAAYGLCASGSRQSPINLDRAIRADLTPLQLDYRMTSLTAVNTGKTIRFDCDAGNTLTLDDRPFELLQFHFHAPSEHHRDREIFPLECHLVHRHRGSGELAVLGILFVNGAANPLLETLWESLPIAIDAVTSVGSAKTDLAALLPGGPFYRYDGSLTTPPCSETVHWIVFERPQTVSTEQVRTFTRLVPANARPIQPRHRRVVLRGG